MSFYGVGVFGADLYVGDLPVLALWPSPSQYPNTTVYPSQGNVPFIRCLISTDDYHAPSRTFADYSNRLRAWTVNRGRPNEQQQFDAGTAEVVLTNRDQALSPTVNPSVAPMNQVRLYAEFNGTTQDLFFGYAEAYAFTWPGGGWSDALATVRCSDEFKVLSRLSDIALSTPAESTGTRIARILDMAASQATRRINFGRVNMAARTGVFQAKSEIGLAADTERIGGFFAGLLGAAFFFGRDGAAVFFDSYYRASQATAAQFQDTGVTGALPYLNLEKDYSDSFLATVGTVEDTGGLTGFASDPVALRRFGARAAQPDPALVSLETVDAGILSFSAFNVVNAYKRPVDRVTMIEVDMGDPLALGTAFGFELLDKITIGRAEPPGSLEYVNEYWVQNISWAGVPGAPPTLRLGVSPL